VAKEIYDAQHVNNPELATLETCVDTLCSSLRQPGWQCTSTRYKDIFRRREEVSKDEYEGFVLAAAIRTNTLATVQRCTEMNPQLLSRIGTNGQEGSNLLFGYYDELVAKYANQGVLEWLLTTGVPVLNRQLRTRLFERAAQYGRADIVRYLYEFRSKEVPWNFVPDPVPVQDSPAPPVTVGRVPKLFGWGEEESKQEFSVLYKSLRTPSLEVLKFVEGLLELHQYPGLKGKSYEYSISDNCITTGRVDTAAHFLRLGASVECYVDIEAAAGRGQVAMMELLVAHGADATGAMRPSVRCGHAKLVKRLLQMGVPIPAGALASAAASGHWDVVQLLLDAGGDPNDKGNYPRSPLLSPLMSAIKREHTEMFQLLVERGADVQLRAEKCVRLARKEGLESMLLLLKEHGVDMHSKGNGVDTDDIDICMVRTPENCYDCL
jgi:hypothetical protein